MKTSTNGSSSSGNKQIQNPNPKHTSEQILRFLAAAKITSIDEENTKQLPTWEDITSMYGDKPVIHGLETCEHYRRMVKPKDRTIGPAGDWEAERMTKFPHLAIRYEDMLFHGECDVCSELQLSKVPNAREPNSSFEIT